MVDIVRIVPGQKQIEKEYFAAPVLEHARMISEFGLAVTMQDLSQAVGWRIDKHFRKYPTQWHVLRELLGEEFVEALEVRLIAMVRQRLEELRSEYPPPVHWDEVWDSVRRLAESAGYDFRLVQESHDVDPT
jgi:hypothetical protein